MTESPPKSLLEFAFKIYLLFMCVLLKWPALDPLSLVHREGPQQVGHNAGDSQSNNGLIEMQE